MNHSFLAICTAFSFSSLASTAHADALSVPNRVGVVGLLGASTGDVYAGAGVSYERTVVRDFALGGLLRASTQGGLFDTPTTSGIEVGVSASYLGLVDPKGWGLRVGGQLAYLSASTELTACGGVLESCNVERSAVLDSHGLIASAVLQPSVHLGEGVRLGVQIEIGAKGGRTRTGTARTTTTSMGWFSSPTTQTNAEAFKSPGAGVRVVVGPTLDMTF